MTGRRFQTFVHAAAPILTVVASLAIYLVVVPLPGYAIAVPSLPTVAVFVWVLWRPERLPYLATFLVGVLEDLLRGTPLGVGAITLLVVHGFTRSQSRFLLGRSLEILWLAFAATVLVGAVVNWLAMSFALTRLLSPWTGLAQCLTTLALFPPVAWLLMRVERALARAA
jgi:rod shape-determining protein MreD